jgi:hypothetical protein
MNQSRRDEITKLAFIAVAVIAIIGFHDIGALYGDYPQRYGVGTLIIPAEEIVFYAWYLLCGVTAVLCLAFVLTGTSLVSRLERFLERIATARWLIPVATALLFGEILLFRFLILKDGPIADDEETYRFIAKTLAMGRLANPSPGDETFFANQFIVLKGGLWYGKYPIGHPLLLALGTLLNLRFLIVPLVTAATFLITYLVGKELFSAREALLGLLLLLLSPQFVFMGATDLSQPTASLFMMLGLLFFIRFKRQGALYLALLSGLMWGYGILVRPFPGTLFVPVVALGFFFFGERPFAREKMKALIIGALPVILAVIALFAVNAAQTGDPYASGYHAAHQKTATVGKGGIGIFNYSPGVIGNSVGGALLRQNFWLFGWPLSLIFIPFARPRRHAFVFFGLIAAVYAYRFIVPKTVVSTLGPVYVTEIIPLLALATAAGIAKTSAWLSEHRGGNWGQLPAAVAVASLVVALACFLPVQLRDTSRGASVRSSVLHAIEKAVPGKALVFSRFLVDPRLESTWAPHPPNPSPDLGDRIIFVRSQTGDGAGEREAAFWRRRFRDRSAWRLTFTDKGPSLKPLTR